MGLQAVLILVKCRNVIGRKCLNNSESLLSFYLCFLRFLLNSFFRCLQDNFTASRPSARAGYHRWWPCDFAVSSGHRFSRDKNVQGGGRGMIHSGCRFPCWTRSSSGVSWQEVQLLAQLPSPPCFSFLTLHPFIDAGKKNLMCSFFAV